MEIVICCTSIMTKKRKLFKNVRVCHIIVGKHVTILILNNKNLGKFNIVAYKKDCMFN